jgi:hypothetical protein
MRENIENDPTDSATKRPNSPPLKQSGSHFIPMQLGEFGYEINLLYYTSPDDLISLFTLYYTSEIVEQIVQYTNEYQREPREPERPHCRANAWYPTCTAEIYTYLAIRIYMTLNVQNEISDYWDTRTCTPSHHITKHMSRNRFQELHMRFRCHGPNTNGPYEKARFLVRRKFKFANHIYF